MTGVLPTRVDVRSDVYLVMVFSLSSDHVYPTGTLSTGSTYQFGQVFCGAPHFEEDQTELGFLTRQGG